VLYLTAETGDRSKSILPPPGGPVGRIFIMVVGGPNIDALLDFYSSRFNLVRNPARMLAVGVIKRAQALADGELTPLATARLAERGNLIEYSGTPGRTRPIATGYCLDDFCGRRPRCTESRLDCTTDSP
jgi:hypothetical protein